MSKTLIVLAVGMLAVGCGKPEKPLEPSQPDPSLLPTNAPPTPIDQNTTKAEPVKELTEEEKQVVGEYEYKVNGDTHKMVFLDNGDHEQYFSGKKTLEIEWSISNGEIHTKDDFEYSNVYRINTDKSITEIAIITGGKRTERTIEDQTTYKKTK